ncbi:ComEC/Rec2 family competence protein [Aestuariibaculum sediminum]|uniref:ComEC family competence protein n=1 Tax=Aestuariibaculum sediminum TaxID=2770637 RepID=A0A8J6Q3N2_9FLAO|nr:ComEC/Rec2 family competence protein [Aestuariibaculum sediminum]MBD0832495.1 ComEC family competence protein [Aestuariibaculum sediminum]
MNELNTPIIKLTFCLVTGIILNRIFPVSIAVSFFIASVFIIALSISFFIAKSKLGKTIWFGLFSYLTMICIGVITSNIHNPLNYKTHYSNYTQSEAATLITFRIREVLKPNQYYSTYVVDMLELNQKHVSGKVLFNLKTTNHPINIKVDDIFITKTIFQEIRSPLNPGQFNYKSYLSNKYIFHQISSEYKELLKVGNHKFSLFGVSDNLRRHINLRLKPYNFSRDVLAIINALVLGQQQDLSNNMYSSYVSAGAIHILAVSGLHVGIILLILNFILKPLDSLKYGKRLKTVIIICLLWSFALIAGLSASVVRAVTMFSVLAIAMNLKRPTNTYNTLFLSMFVILLVKPSFLFEVGFQLSYLAVLSIISVDPILYKLWSPKNKVLNFYWHTFTITISAQIGILPLSLFYFHQFAGLFFITNLVIIPVLGIVLALVITIIVLAVINSLPQFLANGLEVIISGFNSFIQWIGSYRQFVITDIPFSMWQALACYILIIAGMGLYTRKDYRTLSFFLIAVLGLQITYIKPYISNQNKEFIIFNSRRNTLIAHKINHTLYFASEIDSVSKYQKILKDYVVSKHIHKLEKGPINNFYPLNNDVLLIVDSLGIYQLTSCKPNYILLKQSPKINLNRLIDSVRPKTVIADGSNFITYVKNWQQICLKRNILFHYTGEKGAFILSYK